MSLELKAGGLIIQQDLIIRKFALFSYSPRTFAHYTCYMKVGRPQCHVKYFPALKLMS